MLTMFDPPLARALQSQTQFLTRLRLFLAAVLHKCGSSAPRAAAHHRHHLRYGACPEALCNVLSTAEGVTGPVGILIRTDGSSPSNVSLSAGPGTPNPACTLVNVTFSTYAGDIELSSSALLFLDNSFEGFGCHEEHSTAEESRQVLSRCFWRSNIGPS